MKTFFRFTVVIFIFLAGQTFAAQTTEFSYQGKLTDSGSAAEGVFQFQFKLFDALNSGNQIGSTIADVNLMVTSGIFSTKLDFGANALSGANRWLEIAVRRNAGESYTTLSPREQIASAPYAVRTLSAHQADVALDSNKLGGINADQFVQTDDARLSDARLPLPDSPNYIQNNLALQPANFNISGSGYINSNLGIGTLSPISKLTVQTPTNDLGITHTDSQVQLSTRILTGSGSFGTLSNHTFSLTTNGANRLTINSIGNIGIGSAGTTTSSRMYVKGGPQWTSAFWSNSLAFDNGSAIAWTGNNAGQSFGIGQSNGGLYFFRTAAGFGSTSLPPVYDLRITDNGTLTHGGHVTQTRNFGGTVKAMVVVNSGGGLVRCYNGITGSTAGQCGFTTSRISSGNYTVNFGFQITDRFAVLTMDSGTFARAVGNLIYGAGNINTIQVINYNVGLNRFDDSNFTLIVY